MARSAIWPGDDVFDAIQGCRTGSLEQRLIAA
jgi:hypothetical protein